jgi:hypothetical protein
MFTDLSGAFADGTVEIFETDQPLPYPDLRVLNPPPIHQPHPGREDPHPGGTRGRVGGRPARRPGQRPRVQLDL